MVKETETENSIISKINNYAFNNPIKMSMLSGYFILSSMFGLMQIIFKDEITFLLPFENKITFGYGYGLFLPIVLPFGIISTVISRIITPSAFQIKINS